MGMDLNIYAAPNHEVFKHDEWWNNQNITEKYYSRKFWDLVNNCSFIPEDYENGSFFQINKKNIEEMIEIACKYRNYFGTYDDIPKLCELRDEFEELEDNGFHLYFEYDY